MKILVSGGGSGGHVNPAIAMADEFRARHPEADFIFVGSRRGIENDLVPKAGYRLRTIPVKGFSRGGFISKLGPYAVLLLGLVKSLFIVLTYRPDIAFGTGGFASGPVLFWTSLFKIPTLIQEQNVLPGITNKMLSPRVDTIAVAFAESIPNFRKGPVPVVTGNPVRKELAEADRDEARDKLGLGDEKLVVVMGGSQGARPINEAVIGMIGILREKGGFRLILAPGRRHYDEVIEKAGNLPENIEIRPYIYDAEVIFNAADLIVNRAGAMTISEITALGIPAIMVPSPYVAENHQENNARALEAAGGCRVMLDDELSGESLYENISEMLSDGEGLRKMHENSLAFGTSEGLERLANLLDDMLAKGGKNVQS